MGAQAIRVGSQEVGSGVRSADGESKGVVERDPTGSCQDNGQIGQEEASIVDREDPSGGESKVVGSSGEGEIRAHQEA